MGIFDNLAQVDETVETVEENVVQKKSAFIKESGAYPVTMTKLYLDQNDNGTTFFNWEAVTKDGQKISHREWFAGKNGKMQGPSWDFKAKSLTGPVKDYDGFARLKVIVRALTGKTLGANPAAWGITEEKIVSVYDFNAQADKDVKKDVIVDAIGKEVEILVRRTLEDKTAPDPSNPGKYMAINEVRAFNDVKAWLDPDTHKSYSETVAGAEAKSYDAFMKAIAEEPVFDNRDVSKNVDPNAPKEEAAPSEEAKSAFS